MDFSKFFEDQNGNQENSNGPISELAAVLEELKRRIGAESENLNDSGDDSDEADIKWFTETYGSPMEFVTGPYTDMKEPYETKIQEVVHDMVKNKNRKELSSIVAGGLVGSARHMVMMLLDASSNKSPLYIASETAKRAMKMTPMLQSDDGFEQLLNIFSALTVVDMSLAEMAASQVARERIKPGE